MIKWQYDIYDFIKEEKISKQKALLLVVDWSKINKEDYLQTMDVSPVKTVEIKTLLKNALTNKINDRAVYIKGIDTSCGYEGYTAFKLS